MLFNRKKASLWASSDQNASRGPSLFSTRSNTHAPQPPQLDTQVGTLRSAIPLTTTHRGLSNRTGENNCFLNVTIQALWHLGPFRVELQRYLNDPPTEGKLMPALCRLFHAYEYSEVSVLPPKELREILYSISDKFEIGNIADSNEALEVILEQLHIEHEYGCHIGIDNHLSTSSACISHSVFGSSMLEQTRCTVCKSINEPIIRNTFLHHVYSLELMELAKQFDLFSEESNSNKTDLRTATTDSKTEASDTYSEKSEKKPAYSFSKLLNLGFQVQSKTCAASDEIMESEEYKRKVQNNESLPTLCKGRGLVKTFCLQPPLSLAISVDWPSSSESSETIRDFLSLISYDLNLNEIFDNDNTVASKNDGSTYAFRGFVCYYGRHYVSIFQEYSPGEPQFLLFDDNNIRHLGTWNEVKLECIKSLYQPVLLLYEYEKFDSIDTECDLAIRGSEESSSSFSFKNIVKRTKLVSLIPKFTRSLASAFSRKYVRNDTDLRKESSRYGNKKALVNIENEVEMMNSSSNRATNPNTNQESVYIRSIPKSVSQTMALSQNFMPLADNINEMSMGIYSVIIEPEVYNGRNLIGLRFQEYNNRIVTSVYCYHPKTGAMLPAEKTGRVRLLDELVAFNDLVLMEACQNVDEGFKKLDELFKVKNLGEPIKMTFRILDYSLVNNTNAQSGYGSSSNPGSEMPTPSLSPIRPNTGSNSAFSPGKPWQIDHTTRSSPSDITRANVGQQGPQPFSHNIDLDSLGNNSARNFNPAQPYNYKNTRNSINNTEVIYVTTILTKASSIPPTNPPGGVPVPPPPPPPKREQVRGNICQTFAQVPQRAHVLIDTTPANATAGTPVNIVVNTVMNSPGGRDVPSNTDYEFHYITKAAVFQKKYTVGLIPDVINNRNAFGLKLKTDLEGSKIAFYVQSFLRNSQFQERLLPAERSGKIKLGDILYAVNNVKLPTEENEGWKFIETAFSSTQSLYGVKITMKSSTELEAIFQCPFCMKSITVDQRLRTALLQKYNYTNEDIPLLCRACKQTSVSAAGIPMLLL